MIERQNEKCKQIHKGNRETERQVINTKRQEHIRKERQVKKYKDRNTYVKREVINTKRQEHIRKEKQVINTKTGTHT